MKPETQEWTDKAEGDRKVARREVQSHDPVWNVVCFLAQQSAEKYLKALLEGRNVAFVKTHDLVVLLNSAEHLLSELSTAQHNKGYTIVDVAWASCGTLAVESP